MILSARSAAIAEEGNHPTTIEKIREATKTFFFKLISFVDVIVDFQNVL
jgi:hypothetical protein